MIQVTPEGLLEKLPPYEGDKRLLKKRQATIDIEKEIENKHRKTASHYDKIARDHWRGNVYETAKHLYYFLKGDVPYKEEPTESQTVKTPAAILSERKTFGNDCKHFSSYIVGVGEALARAGYPVKCFYRYASYTPGEKSSKHVFAVWVDRGKEIWIDPVKHVRGFDSRAIVPVYVKDKLAPMSRNNSISGLYDISGIGMVEQIPPVPAVRFISGLPGTQIIAGHHTHWLDGGHRRVDYGNLDSVGKAKHKKKPKKHHKGIHIKIKPGKLLAKYGLATSRGAFLSLVELNTFHLATKMWKKAAKAKGPEWNKLAAEWKKLGGNPDKLYKNIRKGVNTHNKLHPHAKITGFEEHEEGYVDGVEHMPFEDMGIGCYTNDMSIGEIVAFVRRAHRHRLHRLYPHLHVIGFAPVAAAGVIAAAAPVLKALSNILKSFGINKDKADEAANEDTKDLAQNHNDQGEEKGADTDGTVKHEDGTETKVVDNGDGTQSMVVKKLPGVHDDGGGGSGGGGTDTDEGGSADDESETDGTVTKTKTKTVTKHHDHSAGGGGIAALWANVTGFVSEHKFYFIGGAVLIGSIVLIRAITHHKKPGRRK